MSGFGLRIRDAAGNVVIDPSTRLTRVLGYVNTGTTAGSVTNSALLDGDFFYVFIPRTAPSSKNRLFPVMNYVAGSTSFSWTFPAAEADSEIWATDVAYGVY